MSGETNTGRRDALRGLAAGVGALGAVAATPAMAGPMRSTILPTEENLLIAALRRSGATLTRRTDRDGPFYEGRTPSNLLFYMYFYGSEDDEGDWMSIQFSASWDRSTTTVNDCNVWNERFRWLKMYLTSTQVRLTLDVNMVGGLTEENATSTMRTVSQMLDSVNRWLPDGRGYDSGGGGGKR